MRNLFQQADISVSDYKSEHASGYRYHFSLHDKETDVFMITKSDACVACPYLYLSGYASNKDREEAFALVIEYECRKGNEWAQRMKDTALILWDMMKSENGEIMYPVKDRDVCIQPCIYSKMITMENATPADVEYYLALDDVVDGGGTIFDICREIVNYDKELELHENNIIELQKFFDERCRKAWDKPYNELSEEEREALSTFSDWHKDVYGRRPHTNKSNRCLAPEKEEGYER